MGILVQKDDDKTELSSRINAELRERSERNSKQEDVDLVKDSAFVDGTKHSSGTTFFWIIVSALAIVSVIVIFSVK